MAMPSIPFWLDRLLGRQPASAGRPAISAQKALAFTEQPRPEGPLVMLQGAPRSVAALMRAAEQDFADLTFLCVGCGAPTSLQPQDDDGPVLLRRPEPVDAQAFLGHWRPDAALVFISALAQPLTTALFSAGIPVLIICDDLPTRAQRRRLRQADRIFAIGAGISSALERLGVPGTLVTACGPLADVARAPGWNEAERDMMARLIAGRPVWLAAQTTPAEDRIMVEAQTASARLAHRLLLILVPDDPDRGPELARRLRESGWQVACRSADEYPDEETQIYLADTRDELGLWYRLAPISFLGGSLEGHGSVDPAAAAALGSAIVHGPDHGVHDAFLERLDAARAAQPVNNAPELARALNNLIAPDRSSQLAQEAWKIATEGAETALSIAARLQTVLDAAERD